MATDADDFQALMKEVGVELSPPLDFVLCVPRKNSVFSYQHAVRSPSGDLELRYRIDSIQRLKEERRIANEGIEVLSSTDLNNLHEYSCMAALFNLSGGEARPPRVFEPEVARDLFGADWTALSFFRLADHDFAPGYNSTGVFCFHKKDVADVYLIGVFNDGYEEGGNVSRLFDEPPGFRFL